MSSVQQHRDLVSKWFVIYDEHQNDCSLEISRAGMGCGQISPAKLLAAKRTPAKDNYVESDCSKNSIADILAGRTDPISIKTLRSAKAELRNFMAILRTGGSLSGAACHQFPFFDVQCLACSIPTTTLLRTPTRISIPSVIS